MDMMTHLDDSEAVEAVAASVRRLFGLISERQARDLAAAVLRDLRREGLCLVRSHDGAAATAPIRP